MSQAGNKGSGGSGPGNITIDGDVSFATGSTISLITGVSTVNSGSSIEFVGNGTTTIELNVTDTHNNTLIGKNTGNLTLAGNANTGFGNDVLSSLTSGNANVGIGPAILSNATTGSDNVGIGVQSLLSLTTGTGNVGIGALTGGNIVSGSNNAYVGSQAGNQNTGADSNNIYLNSGGILGESNTLRIGGATGSGTYELAKCFISGINGNTLGGTPLVVTINSSTDQLGVAAFPSGGSITIDGDSGSASGSTILFTGLNGADNSGASVRFAASGTTVVLNVTDGDSNTLVGRNSGNITLSGDSNTGLGSSSLTSLTTGNANVAVGLNSLLLVDVGSRNVAVGDHSLAASTGDSFNTAVGSYALNAMNGGSNNVALGVESLLASVADNNNTAIGGFALTALNGGSFNTALGTDAGLALVTGTANVLLGALAGGNYAGSESSNIQINTSGVLGENNTLRIGATTGTGSQQLSKAFISGINGNTLPGTPLVVTIDSTTDQLGVAAFPSGGSVTIAGDSGSITGSSLTIYAHNSAVTCGSSVKFVNSGTISTLNITDGNGNTLIGLGAGNGTLIGASNTSVGQNSLHSLTTGVGNLAVGLRALEACTSSSQNMALGYLCMYQLVAGSGQNAGIGYATLANSTSAEFTIAIGTGALINSNGQYNVAIGHEAAQNVLTGTYDLYFGRSAGSAHAGAESSCIYLNSPGLVSESNTLRIGTATGTGNQQLGKAFISGINGNTVSNTLMVTIDSTTDQLGVQAIPSAGITWSDQAGSFIATVQNGYFCTSTLTATLPAAPAEGDSVYIAVDTTGPVIVQANAGQIIRLGAGVSSTAGTATNIARGDSLQLVFRSANSCWFSVSSEGSWNLA